MEIWKPIQGYEMYEISSYGRVRKNYLNGKSRILKTDVINGGYLRVTLSKNGVTERFIVHRLVAMHFIPNENNYPDVNHIDNCRTNNHKDNLEWCTPLMNAQHRDVQERHTPCRKVYQYNQEHHLIAVYRSTRECARKTGYAKSAIPKWCANISKPKNPFIWSYVPLI